MRVKIKPVNDQVAADRYAMTGIGAVVLWSNQTE